MRPNHRAIEHQKEKFNPESGIFEPGTHNDRKEQTMKNNRSRRIRAFFVIILMIAATGATMAYSSGKGKILWSNWISPKIQPAPAESGPVHVTGKLIQKKILRGSQGRVNLSLILQADDVLEAAGSEGRNVDMVIVLDRSGSMQGQKISDARQAALNLLSRLSQKDRFALITYSDTAYRLSDLVPVSNAYRDHLESVIYNIRAGGGTNLGAGLKQGIKTLISANKIGNTAKLILISDGLANKGITNPRDLGRMAGIALEREFTVSTVGVGADFNEHLMTLIADQGAGNYYYLENPAAFAEVFQKEFSYAQATVAGSVRVQIPLKGGVSLVDAAGYPVSIQNGKAAFYPGVLRSGQSRKIFLTFQVPTGKIGDVEISDIKVSYLHNGRTHVAQLRKSFTIACVKSPQEVYSSIDKTAWTQKVLQEDFNRLKQEVAREIKAGEKESAMERIKLYYNDQNKLNAAVGSEEVDKNLNKDLDELREVVRETFQGEPAVVDQKQKVNSKALQYDGYGGRRAQ
jgi:Ca-activated chloride channel family protein